MEYVNMLLDPIIGFAKSRSVSWPPVENGIPALDTDRPKAFKQTLSCPNSPVRIESEEKWADEVGVHKDDTTGMIWRRREFAKENVDKNESSSHQNSGLHHNGSLYGQLQTNYHPHTTPATLSSRRPTTSTVTISSPADAGRKEYRNTQNEDEDDCGMFGHSDCAATHRWLKAPDQVKKPFKQPPSISHAEKSVDAAVITPLPASEYKMMDLAQECARQRAIDTKQVVSGIPRKTTRFGEELLGELYVPRFQVIDFLVVIPTHLRRKIETLLAQQQEQARQDRQGLQSPPSIRILKRPGYCYLHAIPQSPTNIHTNPIKALEDQPARVVNYKAFDGDASAVTISVVDKTDGLPGGSVQTTRSQYKPVNTPIMKGGSLITRQIKTYGIPIDPLAMPDVASAAPCRPKAVAPKGYQITHSKPKAVKKKETIVKKASKKATKEKSAGGDQARNNITQSLPAEQTSNENEKTSPRNCSDPTNKTRFPATVIEVEEVEEVS
ncbi:hypothetical protein BKA61DRAFT_669300 [Leptodontidium sp. MPI-SDFR-AT-0119]|nr:hypothetical protein BKA61DRAFT_669300 [Leptodontidium sp. MPI-SDFR-AT-0119]